MLEIKNLNVNVNGKKIVSQANLKLSPGELIVLLGRNGSGKSSLLNALMGNPAYDVEGSIKLSGKEISSLPVNERANLGLQMTFQQPLEVPGLKLNKLIREITQDNVISVKKNLENLAEKLELKSDLLKRDLNVNLSGGEKKRNELIQVLALNPKVILIDEIDSGLDMHAIKIFAKVINEIKKEVSIIVVSHYDSFLKLLNPDKVYVMREGLLKEESLEVIENGYN